MEATRRGLGVAQILRIVLLLVIIVVAGWLLYTIRGTLLPFVVAFVLSYILTPLVDHMESRGVSRILSVLIIYAGTLAVFVAVFILVDPILVQGVTDMKDRIVGKRAEWACVVVNHSESSRASSSVSSGCSPDRSWFSPRSFARSNSSKRRSS